MTTLAAWVGVDQRGQSSLYLASDSRISWNKEIGSWDYGSKVFASRAYPEIFGYCGDVLFPTQIINKIITSIDEGMLFSSEDTVLNKADKVAVFLNQSMELKPDKLNVSFKILYGTRINDHMKSKFHLIVMDYKNSNLNLSHIVMPEKSQLIISDGSGSKFLDKYISKWSRSDAGGTSRSIFSAFCDFMMSNEDPGTGGAPQLVGLYRIGSGRTFGIIYKNERFYNGDILPTSANVKTVKWHNELFEICDAISLNKNPDAQAQPRPRNV